MPNDPRYEVEDEEIKTTLRKIAGVIDQAIREGTTGRKLGFGLFIFEFEGPAFFWISNAERSDMHKALREWMAREGGQ